jgi:hypothetical protein
MDLIEGQIQTSDRLTKSKENNITHITKEIYKKINDQLIIKLQEIADFICLNYISIIGKKTISFKVPITNNKIIKLDDIEKLESGDLMDGSLIIQLHENIMIEYVCTPSEQCIQHLISTLVKDKKQLKLITKHTPTHIICKLMV